MNKYFVAKTTCVIYVAYADSPERAKEMIETKAHRPVGSSTEEGYCSVWFDKPLVDFQVSKEVDESEQL